MSPKHTSLCTQYVNKTCLFACPYSLLEQMKSQRVKAILGVLQVAKSLRRWKELVCQLFSLFYFCNFHSVCVWHISPQENSFLVGLMHTTSHFKLLAHLRAKGSQGELFWLLSVRKQFLKTTSSTILLGQIQPNFTGMVLAVLFIIPSKNSTKRKNLKNLLLKNCSMDFIVI